MPRLARQFRYWHEIYVSVRKRGNLLVRTAAQDAATGGEHNIQQHQHAERRGKLTEAKEVVMRYAKIGMALVAITLAATPVPAQTTSYSSSSNATVIASATLPSVTSSPLYMRVVGGRIIENRIAAVSTASGVYYQLSGTVALTMNGEPRTIHQNEGIFIPAGANLAVSAVGDDPYFMCQTCLSVDARVSSIAPATAEGAAGTAIQRHSVAETPAPVTPGRAGRVRRPCRAIRASPCRRA